MAWGGAAQINASTITAAIKKCVRVKRKRQSASAENFREIQTRIQHTGGVEVRRLKHNHNFDLMGKQDWDDVSVRAHASTLIIRSQADLFRV